MIERLRPWMFASWVITFLLSIGILVGSLPMYLGMLVANDPTMEFYPLTQVGTWLGIVLSLSATLLSMALAGLLYWRKANEPIAVLLSFFLLGYAIFMCSPFEAFVAYWYPEEPYFAGQIPLIILSVPFLILVLIFPNGNFAPRWTLGIVPVLIVQLTILSLAVNAEESLKLSTTRAQIVNGSMYALFLLSIGIQVYRYRKLYSSVERQQTKWVIYGILLWVLFIILSTIPYTYSLNLPIDAPTPWWSSFVGASWWITLNILPISFTLAIMRSRLWEIDLLIRRTLVYAALTGMLALVYFGGVTLVGSVVSGVTGQQSTIAIVISTLAIAALFSPLRRRVQDFIDRRFYRKKYDGERIMQSFATAARDEVDMDKLASFLLGAVTETMQPERVSLWMKPRNESGPLVGVSVLRSSISIGGTVP